MGGFRTQLGEKVGDVVEIYIPIWVDLELRAERICRRSCNNLHSNMGGFRTQTE